MVDEDSRTDSEDEETKLRHDTAQICHTEYLGTNYTAYSNWGYPHDCTDHLHDDFINILEELSETEEYNTQSIGIRSEIKKILNTKYLNFV